MIMAMHRHEILERIAESPTIFRRVVESWPDGQTHIQPAEGGFAIVEHAWHLADFEEEGIAIRIRRTLTETRPLLADFKGDAIARERKYLERSVSPAPERFAAARAANVSLLRTVTTPDWSRTAVQELVGEITLAELAAAILRHDIAHANEIAALLSELRMPVPDAIAALAGSAPLARSA
jgi:hypothetical protein